MSNVDLIILCGGKGTRLKKITGFKPKILCQINSKPYLEYLLEQVSEFKFNKIILSTGYLSEQIEDWLIKSKFSKRVDIVAEGIPHGTAGAIKNASKNSNDKIIINGDTILDFDYNSFFHESRDNADISIAVKYVKKDENIQSGFINLDYNNRVISFNEKQDSYNKDQFGFVNIGIYYLNYKSLTLIPKKIPYSFEYEFMPFILEKKLLKVNAYIYDGVFIDFGTSKGFGKAKEFLK